jgi:hypothetical protein
LDEDDGKVKKKKVKSDKAKKWKERLGSKKKSKTKKQNDDATDAATAGETNNDVYPKVVYDDGDQSDKSKLPEIGSI